MGLDRSGSFHVLTSPSLCRLQEVSGPRSVGFFPYLDKSLPLPSPAGEWAFCRSGSFRVLTSLSLYHLQDVSGPRLVGFFPCPDKLLSLPSPESEWALVSWFLSVF